jgi:hypothetical protein
MKKRWVAKIPLVIAVAATAVFAFSGLVMLLWNGIIHTVLNVGVITFWQAAGILLLSKILFGGFRGRRSFGGWHHRRHMCGNGGTENMLPVEGHQAKFRCC